jgi:hypothetical protein
MRNCNPAGRTLAVALIALASVSSCYMRTPLPAALKSRPGEELRTAAEAEIYTCPDVDRTARDFWFGSNKKTLCLLHPQSIIGSEAYKVQAMVPRGTVYRARRRFYTNGIDAQGSSIEIELPSVLPERPVIVAGRDTKALLGVEIGKQ